MNEQQFPHPQLLLAISALEARARAADSLNSLAFSIANDPHPLLAFRQALVFESGESGWSLLAVSGLARPTEDSPYLVWLKQATGWLSTLSIGEGGEWISAESSHLPDELAAGWHEWWPTGIWCLNLVDRNNALRGVVVFLLDNPPVPEIAEQLVRLGETWSYCWAALDQKKKIWSWRTTSRQKRIIAIVAAIICLLPVRQTALAPAEVIALDAVVIASPLDGVVKTLHVRPNQAVKKGEPLFSLDDTTLRSRLEVSMKSIAVADGIVVSPDAIICNSSVTAIPVRFCP